jgi:hypothetical protein
MLETDPIEMHVLFIVIGWFIIVLVIVIHFAPGNRPQGPQHRNITHNSAGRARVKPASRKSGRSR